MILSPFNKDKYYSSYTTATVSAAETNWVKGGAHNSKLRALWEMQLSKIIGVRHDYAIIIPVTAACFTHIHSSVFTYPPPGT